VVRDHLNAIRGAWLGQGSDSDILPGRLYGIWVGAVTVHEFSSGKQDAPTVWARGWIWLVVRITIGGIHEEDRDVL